MELLISILVNIASGMISYVLCSILHRRKGNKKS